MRTPDWSHFSTLEGHKPEGPCCLLESSFDRSQLPANYIWTLGYVGTWEGHLSAEVAAQVKSYWI